MKLQHLALGFACLSLLALAEPGSAVSNDLATVKGMEGFGGSKDAREILARNGFVVADPTFKQIFEPYIQSPQVQRPSDTNPTGQSLPSFITTDSAWHTYHVLLEEGVKELETMQAQRLLRFSHQLWTAAREDASSDATDLRPFASVGLALQDEQHRKTIGPAEKEIVDGLRTGTNPVEAPIGFSLSPSQFRAQSFYSQSPGLSDYFAARQWYATVVFRVENARETWLAIALAKLVTARPELLKLWAELSEPFDSLLAPAEDGTVARYLEAVKAVIGPGFPKGSLTDAQVSEIQKKLREELPAPLVSDQLLTPGQYSEFGRQTRGFRLLPPRQLPCAVCFHNTVDPRIPGRRHPSGLDFLAASPILHSPAAARALETQFGKSVTELILKADCGPTPNSLHGEAMRLLATLQKPLPAQAPESMRSDAWLDLQLWTQLGAWAEQRHTWALHTKLSVLYMGMVDPPKGMVAPYPDFFSGLAALSRRTATALEKAGLGQDFTVKTAAATLLSMLNQVEALSSARDGKDFESQAESLEQFGEFHNRYFESHRAAIESDRSSATQKKLESELKEMARRCASTGQANESETATLRLFHDCRQDIARMLGDFAPLCERLAELAGKSLKGEALTEADAKWIEGYGVLLARFHFYYGNSYEVPLDNFPIVTRVFSSPLDNSMLHVGLARPQAIYVIARTGGANQLYRGAVMTYREFVRPDGQILDDDSWRGLIAKGQTPPAPAFTRAFHAETSVAELVERFRARSTSEDFSYGDTEDTLWQIGSRASTNDLRVLLDLLATSVNSADSVTPDIAKVIGRLEWNPYQPTLVKLLSAPDSILADSAAQILFQGSTNLNVDALTSGLKGQPPRARRYYCVLLGSVAEHNPIAGDFLLSAISDADDGVRWQAVLALGRTNRNDDRAEAALLGCLEDSNQFVAAVAARSLARLGATNAAPRLLAELRARLLLQRPSDEEARRQIEAITRDMERSERPVGGYSGGSRSVLDPEHLRLRMTLPASDRAKQMAARRFPPQTFDFPTHDFTLVNALIEALATLQYAPAVDDLSKLRSTDHNAAATRALATLVPERLGSELLAKAADKQLDSYLREQAMVSLCALSLTNHVRGFVPLLDDVTPIAYERPLPGPEWRVCDRAAVSIALMLGWRHPITPRVLTPQEREDLMIRARAWAKSPQ